MQTLLEIRATKNGKSEHEKDFDLIAERESEAGHVFFVFPGSGFVSGRGCYSAARSVAGRPLAQLARQQHSPGASYITIFLSLIVGVPTAV